MATFQIDDYVQIQFNKDRKWSEWDDEIHGRFCGRIGIIEDFCQDFNEPNDPEEDLVKITVYFGDNTFNNGPGPYFAYFKKRHLIKSSQYDSEIQEHRENGYSEYLHFDEFTKNKRDQIFKKIFGPEPRVQPEKIEVKAEKEIENIFEEIDKLAGDLDWKSFI